MYVILFFFSQSCISLNYRRSLTVIGAVMLCHCTCVNSYFAVWACFNRLAISCGIVWQIERHYSRRFTITKGYERVWKRACYSQARRRLVIATVRLRLVDLSSHARARLCYFNVCENHPRDLKCTWCTSRAWPQCRSSSRSNATRFAREHPTHALSQLIFKRLEFYFDRRFSFKILAKQI